MTNDANPVLSASASTPLYQAITLNIAANNARSGDRITISLKARGGTRISWSTGQEFSTSSGIRLNASGQGGIPISNLSVGAEAITLLIAPSDTGAGCGFTLQIFLAASSDIREFTLVMTSDAGSSVSAALPMSEPKPLSYSPTIFDWSPY